MSEYPKTFAEFHAAVRCPDCGYRPCPCHAGHLAEKAWHAALATLQPRLTELETELADLSEQNRQLSEILERDE